MKLSTQEEYGLRCLTQIARCGAGASLTISQISHLEGISIPNVAKVMRVLRRGGFVRSTRGQAGGYSLARSAEEVLVGDVLAGLGPRLFDDEFCARYSGSDALCAHAGDCSIRPVLRQLQDAVDAVMGRLTLGQLLRGETSAPSFGARAVGLPVVGSGPG